MRDVRITDGSSGPRTETSIDGHIAHLVRDGYAVVRDVVQDVDGALASAASYFDAHGTSEMPASAVLADKHLAGILVSETAVAVYKRLLGYPAVLFPNVSVRRNVYTPWHVDRGFVGKGSYIRDPSFRAYQFGVYLNAAERGGEGAPALDVRPGSHVLLRRCPFRKTGLIDAYSYLLAARYRPVTLDVGPRDLLIWDCRVFHRGTPRQAASSSADKLALYWSMSQLHFEHEQVFMRHLVARADRPQGLERFARQANQERYRELATLNPLGVLHPAVRTRIDELRAERLLRFPEAVRV